MNIQLFSLSGLWRDLQKFLWPFSVAWQIRGHIYTLWAAKSKKVMYSITFVFFHVAKTISSVFGRFPARKRPLKAGKLTLTASRGLRPLEAIKPLIVRPLKGVFRQENGRTHLKSFPLHRKLQMNEVKYYFFGIYMTCFLSRIYGVC